MPAQLSILARARQRSQMTDGTALSNNSSNGHDSDGDNGTGTATQKKTRKRVRQFTSDDRAAHRIFERWRREAFREKLIELAEMLPSLAGADINRLSKHTVVHESISRHHEQTRQIDTLTRERDELRDEVTRWCTQAGLPAADTSRSGPGREAELELSLPLSMSLPMSLSVAMPQEQQHPTAPALLLDNAALSLSLDDMSHGVSDGGNWSWTPPFDMNRDMGEADVSLPWSNLDDTDIGQLVTSSMGPQAPSMPSEMQRNDGRHDIEDVIVVNTSDYSRQEALMQPPPDQILWMVS
ncbi:hypothetical protein SPBR_05187 [Sporothrix brasiliensis 5110]|uniref:BHLH domain-containing protein n=1 Tax=Sporothrix brasiliensis 5110 TaxID=1398154 RepID=A0A0C2ELP7_9PEZI|nr:uncharacterized protein SPBR_05187 [Sporothrix brasiliensis 5110]KIH87039.1 hypothetical protein SPBR_05187 [Sporothrix brasiliensis 5110]